MAYESEIPFYELTRNSYYNKGFFTANNYIDPDLDNEMYLPSPPRSQIVSYPLHLNKKEKLWYNNYLKKYDKYIKNYDDQQYFTMPTVPASIYKFGQSHNYRDNWTRGNQFGMPLTRNEFHNNYVKTKNVDEPQNMIGVSYDNYYPVRLAEYKTYPQQRTYKDSRPVYNYPYKTLNYVSNPTFNHPYLYS